MTNHYQRQTVLQASPDAVYQALATPQGLQGWWTSTCDIATAVGGRSTFRFGDTWKVMEIEHLAPDEVRWHCAQANMEAPGIADKQEWVGTRIVFRLSPQGEGATRLAFEHIGLTPALACYGICNDGWNQFLASLQRLVETGQGAPFTPDWGDCKGHPGAKPALEAA